MKATTVLFESLSQYTGQEENIERFCLPLFSKAGSDCALEHVLDAFKKRPAMTQIYASYVAKFLDEDEVQKTLWALLKDASLPDWHNVFSPMLCAPAAEPTNSSSPSPAPVVSLERLPWA